MIFLCICVSCIPKSKKSEPESVYEPPPYTAPSPGDTTKTQPKPRAPFPDGTTYFTHQVKWPGESLSIIAAWYTGKLENWELIAQANPNINPNVIHLGYQIQIPEYMMTTKEPMPRDFVANYIPELRKPQPADKPEPEPAEMPEEVEAYEEPETSEELPELFGPK
jgi:hypothetical protein